MKFDIIDYIKKLRNAGVKQEVAEIQAQGLERVLEAAVSVSRDDMHSKELATRKDLEIAKKDLEKEMEIIRKEIAELRYATLKFIVWTGCIVSAAIVSSTYTMLKIMLH